MKKFKLLFIAFIISLSAAMAQVNITLSDPYEVVDARIKNYFNKGEEAMAVKFAGKKVIIQKFNTTKPRFVTKKEYEDFPEDWWYMGNFEYNDRYYVFYSLRDKKNKITQLFSREIDFAKGTFIDKGKQLFKIDGEIISFNFQTSYGDSKLLMYYRMKPEERRDSKSYDIIGMHVFDEDLSSIWNKEVTMPYTEKKMDNEDYALDSEGNVYIVAIVTNDEAENKKDRKTVRVELLRIKANTSKADILPVNVNVGAEKTFIRSLGIFESADGKLVCAGSYGKLKGGGGVDGLMMFKVDHDGKQSALKTYEIPVEIINAFESERTQRKNEKKEEKGEAEFANLSLKEIKHFEDGSMIVIGEQYYEIDHYDSKGHYMYTSYNYQDVVVSKIDAEGKLAWMKKIPKNQMGRAGRGAMGYQYLHGDNTHYILFLDNEKNKDLKENEAPKQHVDRAGGFLTAYNLDDANGKFKRVSILDMRDVKGTEIYQFNTERILQTGDHEFVFESYKKDKEDLMIKVNFKK